MFLLVVTGGALLSSRASGAPTFDARVTATPGTATDVVVLEGATYGAAKGALDAAALAGSATIPVPLTGMPPLASTTADATFDDATLSLAVRGSTTVLSTPAQLLVTATWANATSTDPDVAVMVRFDAVDLSVLNDSWASVPVAFGPAIVGLTDTAHTVSPNGSLGTDTFLSDGLADTDDAFTLAPSGVNLSAVVSSGAVVDAAGQLGDTTATSGIRLRGTLASSFGVLDGSGSGVGLDISVDIPITTPSSFPTWVTLTSPWTVRLAADSNGDFAAGFSGGMTVSPDGTNPTSVTGSATVAVVGGSTSLTLEASLGGIDDLFGQTWLDLNGANFTATIDGSGFAGAIDASLTIGTVTSDVSLNLAVSSGAVQASLDLVATGPVSSSSILASIGASTSGIDPGLVDVTLNQLAFYVAVDKPQGEPAAVTVSFFADTSLTIGDGTFDAAMLFRAEKAGSTSNLLVSARLTSPTLRELDPSIPFDWQLPDVALIASNAAFTAAYDDLDQPTQLYFEPVLCDDTGACSDLEVTQGLVIEAQIELPADLTAQLDNLGIGVDGPISLTGTLPVLGGTELSLEVELPPVLGSPTDLVKSGQVSFRIATDTVTRQVEASIDGEMVFRVTRSETAGCDGTQDGTWPATTDCFDELTLTVSASITTSPTTGVEINLTGTISNWDQAFGVSWLNIETLRLQLGLKAGGTSPVSLTIGMLGQFVIGDATESSDLTLAFKLEITPTPPWINLVGFTAASGDGIRLQSVAKAFDPTFDTSTLPDLSLKKIWIAYGTQTDESLCIRQGLFLSAELHIGAPPATGSTPGCIPETTLPDDPADLPTDSCESVNTCLASILIDVQTGPTPSFTAAGFIRAFDAGPIHIDSTEVVLQLSAVQQRFYLSGGATITDITGISSDVWASGQLTIDFRNAGGNASLFIDGSVNIGGPDGLTARLTGTVAADFSQLGSGEIAAFLASLDFDLSYELTFPALDEFGNQVNLAFTPVAEWLDTTGNEITSTFDPDSNQDLQNFLDVFAPVSDAPQYAALQGYTGAAGVAAASIQAQSDTYYNYISSYWQLRFYDVTLSDGSTRNARTYFLDEVSKRTQAAVNGAGGLGDITLYGIDQLLIPAQDIGLERINDFRLTVTGVCEPGGSLEGTPVCTGGTSSLSTTTVAPLAGALFTEETSYTLPTGTVAARDAAAPLEFVAALAAPPSDELEAITRLNSSFSSASLDVTCATVMVHYSPEGNVQDPAIVTLNAYGAPTSIQVDLDPSNVDQPISPTETVQDSINTILSAVTPPMPCQEPTQPVGPGGTSVAVGQGTIDEGGTASVSGVTDPAYRGTQITVTWGDGSTTFATADTIDGTWSSSHAYPDDAGPGSSSRFLISATAQGVASANFTRVTVDNVAPTLTLLPVVPTVDEGSSVTVAGNFTDPGLLDGHTLAVTWGDGTPSEIITIPAGQGASFSLSHTYRDDDPSLTPSDPANVVVKLTDSDGGRATASRIVTVDNLAPTDLQLDDVTAAGTPVSRDGDGRAIVPEGSVLTYTGSLRDAGINDAERVSIDWGDSTRGDTAIMVRDFADPTLWHFSASHLYVDDDPTTSPSDLYTVTLFASDDDTGTAIATEQIRVTNLVPVVTVAPISATTENVAITMTATFTDVGVDDTHTAVVDWGDGTAPEGVTISQQSGGGSLTATHTYGDNGLFTVTVTVTDDDSLTGSGTAAVVVANANPTVAIDRSATTSFDGVPTVVGTQNLAVPFAGPISDPGSDDVSVTWSFGDMTADTATNLVNPPATDPAMSPSIQPRSFTTSVDHAYSAPCLYRATLSAVDDDGGSATPDSVDVVILATAHRWETNGFWKNNYDGRSTISAADLACYLQIAGHTSEVFGTGDQVALATAADARSVLFKDTGTSAEQFDRELLVTWLNIANGALALTTPLDSNGDGQPDRTAAAVIADAERVRLDPASTGAQIDAARKALTDLRKRAR